MSPRLADARRHPEDPQHAQQPQHRLVLECPLGDLVLSGDDRMLRAVDLPVAGRPAPEPSPGRSPEPVRRAARQLERYFAGRLTRFELPLDPSGTPFQRQVWLTLAEIPYGTTVTYAELAARVGRPRAFRAVGQANGANPLPIVLPCHRVVATGGGIGGYGGGLEAKRLLLDLERRAGH